MDLRTAARIHAVSRVVVGAALAAVPQRAARGWIGAAARDPRNGVLARAVGARDAALGAGLLLSLGDRDAVRPWLGACAVADAVDCAATLAVREELPSVARIAVPLVAAGSAVFCTALIALLD